MKHLLLSLFLFQTLFVKGQFTVDIELQSTPASHKEEDIFITGNFNRWDPAQKEMKLTRRDNGNPGIRLVLQDIPSDRLEFKFTRGSWNTLECTSKGRLETPRILSLYQDTACRLTIHGWRDDFPASTASENVHFLDSFLIPAFGTRRTVWIYLPADYQTSGAYYPVMYMHDGQQMFDEATSTGRTGPVEWSVDEIIDEAKEKCIVVAINHNEDKNRRIQEYLVFPNEENPVAQGKAYLRFLTDSLKPFVDKHYRTLPGKSTTTLAGSSMGALVSLYGGLMYPDVFGNLGILSPSVWYDGGNIEAYLTDSLNPGAIRHQRYFFYAGMNENRRKPDGNFVQMHEDVKRVIGLLQKKANPEIHLQINPDGRHGASYWKEVFPAFYGWLTNE